MRILKSSEPDLRLRELISGLRRKGRTLDPEVGSMIKGESLVKLRKQYNCSRPEDNSILREARSKIEEYKPLNVEDVFVSRKEMNEEAMWGKERRNTLRAKKAAREKFKKEKIYKFEMKNKSRDLERNKARDRDVYEDYHVSRKEHSERAGKSEHPRKARERARRIEIAAQKQQNMIYTQSQIDARRVRSEKRQARRKANKINRRKGVDDLNSLQERMEKLSISPESASIINEGNILHYIGDIHPESDKGEQYEATIIRELHNIQAYSAKTFLAMGIDKDVDMFVFNAVAFCNWLYQMYKGKSYGDFYSASLAYGMILNFSFASLKDIVTDFVTYFAEYKNSSEIAISPESLTDKLSFIEEVFSKIHSSSFLNKLRDFILSLISLRIFDRDLAKSVKNVLGSPPKGTILDAIQSAYLGAKYMFQFGERIVSGESISSVIVSDDPISAALQEFDSLLKQESMTYSGTPVPGFIDNVEYLKHIMSLRDDFIKISPTLSSLDSRKFRFENSKCELDKLFYRVDKTFRGDRAAPIAIVLHGPPGIGKSELIKIFAQWYSETRGRKFDTSHIFNRTQTSDYMEGYSHSTPIVHYSELGNKNAGLVKNAGDDMLPELQSLIDSLPFSANMAFEDKGKMFMTPELILIDTNNKTMHAELVMSDVGAFLRRFIFVKATVKSEFRMVGGVGLDREKSLADDNSWILDRYDFEVTAFRPTTGNPIEDTLVAGDIYVLRDYLKSSFVDHLEKRNKLNARLIESELEAKYEVSVESLKMPSFSISDYTDYTKDICSTILDLGFSSLFGMITNTVSELPHLWLLRCFMVILLLLLSLQFLWPCIIFGYVDYITSDLSSYLITTLLLVNIISITGVLYVLYAFMKFDTCRLRAFVRNYFSVRANRAKMRIRYLMYETPYNALANVGTNYWTLFLSLGGLITITYLLYTKFLRKKDLKDNILPEGRTSIFNDISVSQNLHGIEQKLEIHPHRIRIKGNIDNVWNDQIDSMLTGIVNTHSAETLYNSLSNNVRMCEVKTEKNTTTRTHIFGLRGTIAVINKHSLEGCKNASIFVFPGSDISTRDYSGVRKVEITPNNSVDVGRDVLLFDTGSLHFKDAVKHLLDGNPTFIRAKGRLANMPVDIQTIAGPTLKDPTGPYVLDVAYLYDYPTHSPGSCGIPLLIDHNGASAVIGIHVGGRDNHKEAFATPLMGNIIRDGISKLESKVPLIPIMSLGFTPEMKTMEPVRKSPFRYEKMRYLDYLGKIPGPVMVNNTSTFYKVPGADFITDTLEHVGIHKTLEYSPPLMKHKTTKDGGYVSPYNTFYRKMDSYNPPLDWDVLGDIITELVEHASDGLRQRGITSFSPLTVSEAVNGIDDDPFMRRINASTAAGFGLEGKKKKHIPLIDEITREPTEELSLRIRSIFDAYENGFTVSPIHNGALKDEMRPLEKVQKGSTRVFFVTPLDFLIVSRCLLAPFFTILVENCDLFGSAVGINMHLGADNFIRELIEFSSLLFEGDYESYDIKTPPEIARAANTVIYLICKAFGYNAYALNALKGILSDNMFPVMQLLTDLFIRAGFVTSGKYATAEDNCLRNLVIMMYVFYKNPELSGKKFFECVKPRTYGDDLLAAVKEDISDIFNIVTFSRDCKKHLDMNFTTSDKSEITKKFETIDTCSFLKRKFVLHPSGIYIAPLDSNSIHRAMCWNMPSRSVTIIDQMVSTYRSELYEVFFHVDENGYNRVRNCIKAVMKDFYGLSLEDSSKEFPSYAELYLRLIVPQEINPNPLTQISPEILASSNMKETGECREESYLARDASVIISHKQLSRLAAVDSLC